MPKRSVRHQLTRTRPETTTVDPEAAGGMAPIHLAWAYSARQRRLIAATASQSAERISNADVLDQSALYSAASVSHSGKMQGEAESE